MPSTAPTKAVGTVVRSAPPPGRPPATVRHRRRARGAKDSRCRSLNPASLRLPACAGRAAVICRRMPGRSLNCRLARNAAAAGCLGRRLPWRCAVPAASVCGCSTRCNPPMTGFRRRRWRRRPGASLALALSLALAPPPSRHSWRPRRPRRHCCQEWLRQDQRFPCLALPRPLTRAVRWHLPGARQPAARAERPWPPSVRG